MSGVQNQEYNSKNLGIYVYYIPIANHTGSFYFDPTIRSLKNKTKLRS